MRTLKLLLPLCTAVALAGCSSLDESSYSVTYDSIPQRALLVCSGQARGETPKTLSYELDDAAIARGWIQVQHCYAQWPSGARVDYDRRIKVYPGGGTVITAKRPSDGTYGADFAYEQVTKHKERVRERRAEDRRRWEAYEKEEARKAEQRRRDENLRRLYERK